jgi:hypothetical protein
VNLALVAEVVSGKITSPTNIQERRFILVKDYYNGRRSALLGAGFLALALGIMATSMLTGVKISILTMFALGALIYGAICLVWGIGHWMESSSEMKAIELTGHSHPSQSAQQPALALESEAVDVSKVKPTDPITAPASVTESTTRQLDERGYRPPAATKH